VSALGVHDDVALDYWLAADNLGADFFRDLNHLNARVDLTSLMGSDAAVMLQALGLVRELAGDASTLPHDERRGRGSTSSACATRSSRPSSPLLRKAQQQLFQNPTTNGLVTQATPETVGTTSPTRSDPRRGGVTVADDGRAHMPAVAAAKTISTISCARLRRVSSLRMPAVHK